MMAKFPKNFTNPEEGTVCVVSDSFLQLSNLNTMCVNSLTWEVQGGEGIRLCTSDHVRDLVHDTLLS